MVCTPQPSGQPRRHPDRCLPGRGCGCQSSIAWQQVTPEALAGSSRGRAPPGCVPKLGSSVTRGSRRRLRCPPVQMIWEAPVTAYLETISRTMAESNKTISKSALQLPKSIKHSCKASGAQGVYTINCSIDMENNVPGLVHTKHFQGVSAYLV